MTDPAPPEPMLWTVERTATELGVSRSHIYRLIRENKIPFVRLSESVLRFDPPTLRQWIVDRQIRAVR